MSMTHPDGLGGQNGRVPAPATVARVTPRPISSSGRCASCSRGSTSFDELEHEAGVREQL